MKKRLECKIIGAVQGVFFRQSVKQKAGELGLAGWVRNENDGSVKIVAEGKKADLQKLLEWARLGTEWAKVEKIKVEWKEGGVGFKEFNIKY